MVASVFCFICLLSVVVQLGFPGDRLTSRVYMMGRSVSWWTRNDIEKLAKDSTRRRNCNL